MAYKQPQESTEGVVTLSEEDAATLARVILWLYFGNYPLGAHIPVETGADSVLAICLKGWTGDVDKFDKSTLEDTEALTHLKIFKVADFFVIPTLRELAWERFEMALWPTRWPRNEMFLPCLEYLDNLPPDGEEAALKVIVEQASKQVFTEKERAVFKEYEELYPELKAIDNNQAAEW